MAMSCDQFAGTETALGGRRELFRDPHGDEDRRQFPGYVVPRSDGQLED